MCMDFTDLNKYYPKDPYPLPRIDRLINSSSEFRLLSFMGAYSGYNKIHISPLDDPKTVFMTVKSNYYYKVMPFGLKNSRATYQQLMDMVSAS